MSSNEGADTISDRQAREREFHKQYAEKHRARMDTPVALDIIQDTRRRPWNGHWTAYDLLMRQDLPGKRVMLPGCGFGEDAIRLALLGAEVYASELSPDLLDIAAERARRMGVTGIRFDVMPAEATIYEDDFFDLVFFNDVLHHVDIAQASREAQRVLKPGAVAVVNELFTHSSLQKIRQSRFVDRVLYPRMVSRIYGTSQPYITEDEHKIDENELAEFLGVLSGVTCSSNFLLFGGRLYSNNWMPGARLDQALFKMLGRAGRVFAGRIVLLGHVRKPSDKE